MGLTDTQRLILAELEKGATLRVMSHKGLRPDNQSAWLEYAPPPRQYVSPDECVALAQEGLIEDVGSGRALFVKELRATNEGIAALGAGQGADE